MTNPNLPQTGNQGEAQIDQLPDHSRPRFTGYISAMVIGIAMLIVLIHIGFFNSYIKHFPKFEDADVAGLGKLHFNAVQHFHGIVMMGWVFMLLLQPILIRSGKFKLHRMVGRLSYVLAPLVLISIFLVNRQVYHEILNGAGQKNAVAFLSLTFPGFVFFGVLYFLAIRYRHRPALHMRFMASTAFLFIPPALDRLLVYFYNLPGYDVGSVIELSIIGAVVIIDSVKTKKLSPFILVFAFESLHKTFWHSRETDFWQSIGGVVAKLF